MKNFLTLLLLSISFSAFAQPKNIDQAIISIQTITVHPVLPSKGKLAKQNVPESNTSIMYTTWIKNNLAKTFSESDYSKTTTLRDNNKKTTTTLVEILGNQTSFYLTDEEQAVMNKRMDSLKQKRMPTTTTIARESVVQRILYSDQTKKIADFLCKKAIIITKKTNGILDSNTVWYCPNFTAPDILNITFNNRDINNLNTFLDSATLVKLQGFPMEYELKMSRGRKMMVTVCSVELNKAIADKEFEMPQGFKLKAMKNMRTAEYRDQQQ